MASNGEDKNNPLENGVLIREKIRVLEGELKRLESQSLEEGELEGEGEKNEATTSGPGTDPDWVREGGYVRVTNSDLYYHYQSGYYYESISGQFLIPSTSSEQKNTNNIQDNIQDSDPKPPEPVQETESTVSNPEAPPPPPPPVGMTGDIASQLAAVSDHATQSCGYVFDERTGYYYDHNTGLYYDQANRLYYDPENSTYYYYDYESRQYVIHSQVEVPVKEYDPSDDVCLFETETPLTMEERLIEDEVPTQLDLMFENDDDSLPDRPPPMSEWPPCVRLIPLDPAPSSSMGGASELAGSKDARKCISLITAEGAVIGREVTGPQSLRIVDIKVSKVHCEISFKKKREVFVVKDCGSQNGTFINDNRLSQPKEESKSYLLQHGDHLKVGGSPFLLHIHRGMSSCGECSSMGISVVGADDMGGASTDESLEIQRRKGLNKLKKKYGLRLKDSFGDELHKLPDDYTDKAAARRKKYGIELPQSAIRDDSPSTVNDPISSANKGHQMLKKFGWREGDSLGAADNKGITEPISTFIRSDKAGLGFSGSLQSLDSVNQKGGGGRGDGHNKMLRRYQDTVENEKKRKRF